MFKSCHFYFSTVLFKTTFKNKSYEMNSRFISLDLKGIKLYSKGCEKLSSKFNFRDDLF